MKDDLIPRLRKRAEIRRQITTRKSVQNNEPDRLADLLEEAADKIIQLQVAYEQEQYRSKQWQERFESGRLT